jgi:hypothetical protein
MIETLLEAGVALFRRQRYSYLKTRAAMEDLRKYAAK